MPRPISITKERILDAAYKKVERSGGGSLTIRGLGDELGCSTQPIFSSFQSLEGLQKAVKEKAASSFKKYVNFPLKGFPPLKSIGLRYIRFASKEPHLFHLLFEGDDGVSYLDGDKLLTADPKILEIVMRETGLSKDDCGLLYLENWIFAHGLAVMIVNKSLLFDEKNISRMLSDVYQGTLERFLNQERGGKI